MPSELKSNRGWYKVGIIVYEPIHKHYGFYSKCYHPATSIVDIKKNDLPTIFDKAIDNYFEKHGHKETPCPVTS